MKKDNVAQFGAKRIHHTNNLVKIEGGFSGSWHSEITAIYNSIQPWSNGVTVRQFINSQNYENQFK